VNQLLFASKLSIENAGIKDNKSLSQALEYLTTAIEEIRKIALESTSQFIFNDYFVDGIIDYFLKINFTSKLKFSVDNRITDKLNINENIKKHIFRICQELAQNALKHSQGTKMSFRFIQSDDNLILIAKDNGIGIQKSTKEGIGLKSIKDRVYLMNGKVRLFNNLFKGLTIYIEVKLT
jgi:signal transduction histidine kinase